MLFPKKFSHSCLGGDVNLWAGFASGSVVIVESSAILEELYVDGGTPFVKSTLGMTTDKEASDGRSSTYAGCLSEVP